MNEKVDIYHEYGIVVEHIHYNKLAPDCADDLQEIFSELSAILFAVKESGSGQDGGVVKLDEESTKFRLWKIY